MNENLHTTNVMKNSIYSILITVITGCVNTVYPLIVGIIFGAEIIGDFSFLFSWIILISIPIVNGITPSIARFIAANSKVMSKKIEGDGLKYTIFYLIIVSFTFPFFSLIFDLKVFEIMIIILSITFYSIHSVFRKSMQGEERFRTLFKYELASFLFFIPFSILSILLKMFILNYNAVFILLLPILFFNFIFDIFFIKTIIANLFFWKLNILHLRKRILSYAMFVGLGSLFSLGLSQSQIIISDLYLSREEVGILGFWSSAMSPIVLLYVALSSMLISRVTNLKRNDHRVSLEFISTLNWSIHLLFLPFFGIIILIVAFFPQILDYLTFNRFNMVLNWPIFVYFLIGYLSNFLTSPSVSLLSSSEKLVHFNPFLAFFRTVVVLLFWIFSVPKFGMIGFALGFSFGGVFYYIVVHIVVFFISNKKVGKELLFYVFYISLIYLFIFFDVFHFLYLLIIFCIINIPLFSFGIIKTKQITRTDEYSIRYE